jgi:hypothetical protein
LYEILNQDLAAFPYLFPKREAAQRQYVFANKRNFRKRRQSVRIYSSDKKVTINVAVEQLTIVRLPCRERIAILR